MSCDPFPYFSKSHIFENGQTSRMLSSCPASLTCQISVSVIPFPCFVFMLPGVGSSCMLEWASHSLTSFQIHPGQIPNSDKCLSRVFHLSRTRESNSVNLKCDVFSVFSRYSQPLFNSDNVHMAGPVWTRCIEMSRAPITLSLNETPEQTGQQRNELSKRLMFGETDKRR